MTRDEVEHSLANSVHGAATGRSAVAVAFASLANATERDVAFETSDGWKIAGMLHVPARKGRAPGVVLVHGSVHEGDAYGQVSSPGLSQTLSRCGVATLRIDIRGRGASRAPREFHSMSPQEREAVRLDVKAAINYLASLPEVNRDRIGVVAEQDSVSPAVIAIAKDRRVAACVFVSGRLNQSARGAVARISAPLFCLVSKEDKRGFKDMIETYLSSKNDRSRLKVFEGLAFGTTMFSTWLNEFPNEQPIEEMIGDWLTERLKARARAETSNGKK